MAIETHVDWITGSYTTDVQYILEISENNALYKTPTLANLGPKADSVGSVFIGYGYDLLQNAAGAAAALQAAGATIADPQGLTSLLESLTAPVSEANLDKITGYISLPVTATAVSAFATKLLQTEILSKETDLTNFLEDNGMGVVPASNERVALMDLYYQDPGGNKRNGYFESGNNSLTNLSRALQSGNRAEAWFEIRYRSSDDGEQGLGIVARRYVDSQLFGLYTDDLQATETEALQAYQVLSANRATIIKYEQEYGSDPYGSGALTPAGSIAAANQTYNLAGTGAEVQTLAEIFEPAAQEELQYLEGLYSGVLPDIQIDDTGDTTSSGFDVRSIDFYATSPSLTGQTLDAGDAPYAPAAEDAANHILLGTQTGDQLIGGEGSDILVAQSGNETLQAGAGSDTLIANSGNDTLQLGGSSDVIDFVFPGTSGYVETVIENNGAAVGQIDIGGSQIGTDLTSTGSDTWTDGNGSTYQFLPDPSSPPGGYFPGTSGSDVGELKVVLGGLSGGNEIDIWGFNLSQAEDSGLGFLGITLPPSISLTAGATAGVDPPAPDFTAGSSQSYTVSVDAPTESAETVTVALTGAPASDFGLVSGTSIIPINSDGTFTVTIPAGQISASFSLANTGDVGSAANLQLVASLSNPSDPTGQAISSTPLAQNYVEPAVDPFGSPSTDTLYYQGVETIPGGATYNWYEGANGGSSSGTPVDKTSDGNNYIYALDDPGDSINGGTGNDTIYADFGFNESNGGVNVINGNGGQDAILVGSTATPYTHSDGTVAPDGPTAVAIYANSQTNLATAIADANTDTSTGQQGDIILAGYIESTVGGGLTTTVVGGNGNDLIIAGGVIVAGSGNDTIAAGAPFTYITDDWINQPIDGVTWNTSFANGRLTVGGGSGYLETSSEYEGQAASPPPAGYEGNLDQAGGEFDAENDTIYGGAGKDLILLSNGSEEVHLGVGDSTVLGGMGNDTIFGGSGNDSVLGGGGNEYVTSGSGNDWIAGRGGNNTIFGGSGSDTIFAGGSDSNWATEETGENYVQAGSGNTLIFGSGGNDTLIGGAGTDTINGGGGSESIVAGSGDTSINGGAGPDTIVAGSGSDTIWGSTESTTIYGGTGTDQILGTSGTDVIYAGDGGTAAAPTGIIAGSGDTTIYGGQGVDQIWGGSGNDVIYAGDGGTAAAATQVDAGAGDSTIYGGDGVDHIFGGSGTDVLYAGDGGDAGSPTYVMAGTGAATLYGGAGASVLTDSDGGNDVLEAGSGDTTINGIGQDTLIAGSGSDYLAGGPNSTYIFGANTQVAEVADNGAETLEFTSTVDPSELSLSAAIDGSGAGSLDIDEGDGSITIDGGLSGANVTSVDFEGSQSMSLTQLIQQEASEGNVTGETVAGSQGNLVFDAGTADALVGDSSVDTISAWGDNDTLSAGSGGGEIFAEATNDLVTGGSANDTLDAAAAGTTLVGGTGNEVFEVNDATDVVEGQADAASNQVYSSVSFTLPTNVDVLTLTGTANLSATGNDDAGNLITGNSGSDTLIAGSGDDTLVSGSGVDTLVGGSGPNTFVINNSADVIEPAAYEGWQDTVESSVSYVLSAAVSTLDLTGSGNLSATDDYGGASITGNAGNDTLIGGSGSDTLIAGSGVDTLEAGTGNNTFVVNNVGDIIQVGSTHGSDTVESSVSYTLIQGLETLELTGSSDLEGEGNADPTNLIDGNSGNDTLVAGSGSDTLVAGSGSDTLVAGSGTDVLKGGSGSTAYVFNSGFGQAEVEPGSGSGTIEFGAGIAPSDLTIGLTKDSSGNPALLIEDGSGAVTVDGGLTGSIGTFSFADGTQLTLAGLLAAANVTSASLPGASGNAVLDSSSGASLSGGYGDDTLIGTGASDTLVAGTGHQQLLGVGSGDVLSGGIGADTLYGGIGADTLVGGAGTTVMYGGDGTDTIALTQGGTVTFYPSGTPGAEVIELPNGMTLADFTSFEDTNGDLILQSLTGDTTAVVKGYYGNPASSKTWVIADSAGDAQLLTDWLNGQQQSSSEYAAQIDQLRQASAANLAATLNQIGQQGGSIKQPDDVVTSNPDYNYQFTGVTTQNETVQGGVLNLPTSEEDQRTYTYEQTGSYSYSTTEPVYSEVTIPGQELFIAQNDPNLENDLQSFSGEGATPGLNAQGQPGYWVTLPPTTETEQTGTTTLVHTVPQFTEYTTETQAFVAYNVSGDGGNDVITADGPFVGTVETGNGNVSVNLGMSNGDYVFSTPVYYPNNGLAPGAFIEAGNGNDTIVGSGGADEIAAGTGFDNILAGLGSTVYVPLEGASTEDIYVQGPFYGGGPLPHSTLVLPNGVTPEDLQYRLISDLPSSSLPYPPNMPDQLPDGEALEITYGGSTVLVNFGFNGTPENNYNSAIYAAIPADDNDGIDQFQFSDGTVLSRAQILAMAGPAVSASSFNPVVTSLNPVVSADSTVAGGSLFSASDSSGSAISWYQISNTGDGGGHFLLNGVAQTPGQAFYVSSEQLPQLTYVAGSGGSVDAIQVAAFDGVVWGNPTTFNLAVSSSLYEATGPDQEVTGGSNGPDTLIGGYGADTLVGSSGQDTFDYNSGSGAEALSETATVSSTSNNVVQFGTGITPSSITLSATGDPELVLSIGSSGDSTSIEGFDPLNPLQSFPIQSFMFSDGTALTPLQLLSDGAVTGTSGSIANADGSVTRYDFTPSGQQIYYAQNVNSSGQLLTST